MPRLRLSVAVLLLSPGALMACTGKQPTQHASSEMQLGCRLQASSGAERKNADTPITLMCETYTLLLKFPCYAQHIWLKAATLSAGIFVLHKSVSERKLSEQLR